MSEGTNDKECRPALGIHFNSSGTVGRFDREDCLPIKQVRAVERLILDDVHSLMIDIYM